MSSVPLRDYIERIISEQAKESQRSIELAAANLAVRLSELDKHELRIASLEQAIANRAGSLWVVGILAAAIASTLGAVVVRWLR